MENFKCMLAKPLDERKLSFPCLVSPKLDGIRAQYYKGEFYTRNKKVIKGLSHLKAILADLQEEYHLDGELLIPGLPFQKSSGRIRSFAETPDAVFHVFDLPYMERPQEARLSSLSRVLSSITSSHVKLVTHIRVNQVLDISMAYTEYREAGYEGAMVKQLHGMYSGKRSDAWMKMKEIETYDVQCIGFFEGQGRLTGSLGGLIVELDGVQVRVGGGFSDFERDEIWRNQETYLDCVCEIVGQELTPGGSLRHPRFITWRPDKEE